MVWGHWGTVAGTRGKGGAFEKRELERQPQVRTNEGENHRQHCRSRPWWLSFVVVVSKYSTKEGKCIHTHGDFPNSGAY